MNTNSISRNIMCGLICMIGLLAGAEAYAWHDRVAPRAGWGYHGNWGHGYGWSAGHGWRNGTGYYYGAGYRGCSWVGAHWNRWGVRVPAHRVCW